MHKQCVNNFFSNVHTKILNQRRGMIMIYPTQKIIYYTTLGLQDNIFKKKENEQICNVFRLFVCLFGQRKNI